MSNDELEPIDLDTLVLDTFSQKDIELLNKLMNVRHTELELDTSDDTLCDVYSMAFLRQT